MTQEAYIELLKKIPELMQHSNLSFLLGAGCSFSAGLPLMHGLTSEVCNNLKPIDNPENDGDIDRRNKGRQLLIDISSTYPDESNCNVEHYLSEIQDII